MQEEAGANPATGFAPFLFHSGMIFTGNAFRRVASGSMIAIKLTTVHALQFNKIVSL
jgi:hypothetical protein